MSDDERLVSVRQVPDETTATLLCDFLRTNGVPATAVAIQIPWLPGVETFRQGYWGHVEVMEHDAERAKVLIDDFFEGEVQPEPGLEGDTESRHEVRGGNRGMGARAAPDTSDEEGQ